MSEMLQIRSRNSSMTRFLQIQEQLEIILCLFLKDQIAYLHRWMFSKSFTTSYNLAFKNSHHHHHTSYNVGGGCDCSCMEGGGGFSRAYSHPHCFLFKHNQKAQNVPEPFTLNARANS